MPREFYGGIETDKVGELGTGYARSSIKLTRDRKYLDAAIRCGRSLASHVRHSDDQQTPWPFRVDARTGVTDRGFQVLAIACQFIEERVSGAQFADLVGLDTAAKQFTAAM